MAVGDSTHVPVDFTVVAGRDAPKGRLVDKERLFALMPLIDDEVNRLVNRQICECLRSIDAGVDALTAEDALKAWYRIHALINMRKEFVLTAQL